MNGNGFFMECGAPEAVEDFVRRTGAPENAVQICKKLISHLQDGHVCMFLTESECRAVTPSPVVSVAPDDSGIFILDGKCFYPRRYWKYEQQIRRKVTAMASAAPEDFFLIPSGYANLNARQREALEMMKRSSISILTGGPGTGKTFTIASAVRLARRKNAALRIVLAAPTGKAAARVKESIQANMRDAHAEEIPDATTIHRLLEPDHSGVRFLRNRENPLDCDWVIVDEASMIDLPLMAKLADAIPDGCRLTLVGDAHQLASVENGRVFGDLCDMEKIPKCELTQSRRFPDGGDIDRLAREVNAGAADHVLAILAEKEEQKHLYFTPLEKSFAGYSRGWGDFGARLQSLFAGFARQTDEKNALAHLNDCRILCAMRRGPYGVDGLNNYLFSLLGLSSPVPVLITANDRALGVNNGDTGVVMPRSDALFLQDATGEYRRIPLGLLPHREVAFASTVHKAQGSEFSHVVIVLPGTAQFAENYYDNPLLTREILYTAITRTKENVYLYAGEDAIRHCCDHAVRRDTGVTRSS